MKARMVGRISVEYKTLFHIMNGQIMKFVEPIEINGVKVDLEAQNVKVKRDYDRKNNRLLLQLHADLRILSNNQNTDLTVRNLHEIEETFNSTLQEKTKAFDVFCKEKDWDLLGI